jgi:hypothetical protein
MNVITPRDRNPIRGGAPTWLIFTLVVITVVIVAVVTVGLYVGGQTPVVQAGNQGDAEYDTPGLPSVHLSLHCNGNTQPTADIKNSAETKTSNASYKLMNTENCQVAGAQDCKKQTWEVTVDHDWTRDLDAKKEVQHDHRVFDLACPCMCPSRLLNLQWKDFERRPYPNGEAATYYNVRFKLTDAANDKEVATWTAWVRVPGGHTHYGDEGFKQIKIDPGKCSTPAQLIECAEKELGQELAQPPGNS